MTNYAKRQLARILLDISALALLGCCIAVSVAIIEYAPYDSSLVFGILYFGAVFGNTIAWSVISRIHFRICQKYNLLTEDEYKKLKETK